MLATFSREGREEKPVVKNNVTQWKMRYCCTAIGFHETNA